MNLVPAEEPPLDSPRVRLRIRIRTDDGRAVVVVGAGVMANLRVGVGDRLRLYLAYSDEKVTGIGVKRAKDGYRLSLYGNGPDCMFQCPVDDEVAQRFIGKGLSGMVTFGDDFAYIAETKA